MLAPPKKSRKIESRKLGNHQIFAVLSCWMFFLALPVHPGPWDRPSHRWPQASNPRRSLGKKSANHDLTATDPKAADC